MAPLLRQFDEMGLHSHWIPAGKIVFRENEVAENVYVVVSGRLRLFHAKASGMLMWILARVICHMTSAIVVLIMIAGEEETVLEVGRGECVGEMALLAGDDSHSQSCSTVRDTEIVIMPRRALQSHLPNHSM